MDVFRRIIDDTATDPATAARLVDDAVRLSLKARDGRTDDGAQWPTVGNTTGMGERTCAGLEAMDGPTAGMPDPDPALTAVPAASPAPVTLW